MGKKDKYTLPRRGKLLWEHTKLMYKKERCIFCYTYPPHIYILPTCAHTHTHAPLGLNPFKKYESSSYWSIWGSGASDWCVESFSCSEEYAWKPGILLEMLLSCRSFVPHRYAVAQTPANFTSFVGKRGCSSFGFTHTVASCCETMVTEGTAAMETSSIYVHR